MPLPTRSALRSRRLREGKGVRFLVTRRPGRVSPQHSFDALRPERLEVGPLSLGAVRRLLHGRLGLSLPRHRLRRLVDLTGGNPLHALEVGALLATAGVASADELPLPDSVESLLLAGVDRLAPETRRLLLAAALDADLYTAAFAELGAAAFGRRGRLGRAHRRRRSDPAVASPSRRGRAEALHEPVSSARFTSRSHAWRSTMRPACVTSRSRRWSPTRTSHRASRSPLPPHRRAAPGARRWSSGSMRFVDSGRRPLARPRPPLGAALETAGELRRVTDLLTAELDALPVGPWRAEAWLLLTEGAHIAHLDDYREHLEHALREAGDDPSLRARIVAKLSSAVISVERISEESRTPLPCCRERGRGVPRSSDPCSSRSRGRVRCAALLSTRSAIGSRPPPGSRDTWPSHPSASPASALPGAARSTRARERLGGCWRLRTSGEARTRMCGRGCICASSPFGVGDWEEAGRLLEGVGADRRGRPLRDAGLRTMPCPACGGARTAGEAERWAAEAISRAEAIGTQWDLFEALRARATAALLQHDARRAAESLWPVWEHLSAKGSTARRVPARADLVEALGVLGEHHRASAVAARLRTLALEQGHPWELRRRSAATLSSGSRPAIRTEWRPAFSKRRPPTTARSGSASTAVASALGRRRASTRAPVGRRTRRACGRGKPARRRLGGGGSFRAVTSRVAASFGGSLTEAEARVAGLAAEGLSNKEIAARLVVTVHTVEKHLSHAYAKLGVRSRGQLPRRLAALE